MSQIVTEPQTNSESTITIAAVNASKDNWEWKCLLSTFDKVNWQIRRRRLDLIVFGEEFGFDRNAAVDIRFFGVSSREKTEQILSTAQIMYCSQSFDPEFAERTRSNVPPELSLFLRSGRPTVFHAPIYAASVDFLRTHKAAALCHSSGPVSVELYNCFDRLIFDSEYYEQMVTGGLQAADQEMITAISQEQLRRCVKAND